MFLEKNCCCNLGGVKLIQVLSLIRASRFQLLNNSQKDYEKYIFSYSLKNQLRYRGNLGKFVIIIVYTR